LTYKLQVERRVRRALVALPQRDYIRIERAIDGLANEPRPRGTKKLHGGAPLWRLRVGEYRVIYAVFDRERIVKIVGVARRREDTYDV
jgi:mRNA interferase RelE/StbE